MAKKKVEAVVRTAEQIDKQCQELINAAGVKQYQVAVLKAELMSLNQQLQNAAQESQALKHAADTVPQTT